MRVRLRLCDCLSRLLERLGEPLAWLRGFAFADGDLAFLLIGVLMTFGLVAVTTAGNEASIAVANGTAAGSTSAETSMAKSSRALSGSAMTPSSDPGSPAGCLTAGGEEES